MSAAGFHSPMGFVNQQNHHLLGGATFVGPWGSPASQLELLLPQRLVQDVLVPSGQMADVACACGVKIDILEMNPTVGQLHVRLTGTCVANSLAAVQLQWRLFFADVY
eukprot:TRINITY_DN76126_c0_g1_i1.p3 TRINITY_DN76126_c0_g1~~TRINITY_DN76126_c0_g1_i1.p3  ORF type:complete len:120 (-),score=21.77 TRINITY_DN76126_c0_g1_i1:157-480(-)